MYQKLIEYFESRSVLILGFGREGRSTYAFIRKYYPDKPLGVADIKRVDIEDENVRVFSGDGYLDAVKRYDLIMQSPGISMRDVKIPDQVEKIVKCFNPNCITNNEEVPTRFEVIDKKELKLRCHYCEKITARNTISFSE